MQGEKSEESNNILSTETLNINGSCLDFQKREHVWIFYLKDCQLGALSSKKFHFVRDEPWLVLICFKDEMSSTTLNASMIDQEIYESKRWQSMGGSLNTAPIVFAVQCSSSVRKQVHTIFYENIVVHFPVPQRETWSIARSGRAHFPLIHSKTAKTSLSQCLLQEQSTTEYFTDTLYKRTKRRGR